VCDSFSNACGTKPANIVRTNVMTGSHIEHGVNCGACNYPSVNICRKVPGLHDLDLSFCSLIVPEARTSFCETP